MEGIGQYHDIKIAKRLKIFRETYIHKYQYEAARMIGINQGTLSLMERGKGPIHYEFVTELEKKFGLNSEWLGRGEGNPQDNVPQKSNLVKDTKALLLEIEVLRKQLKMMESNQKHFIKIIERLDNKVEALEKKFEGK